MAAFVHCDDCHKYWRFGCEECAEHFAEYHRGAFEGHAVRFAFDSPERLRRNLNQLHRQQRRWWE